VLNDSLSCETGFGNSSPSFKSVTELFGALPNVQKISSNAHKGNSPTVKERRRTWTHGSNNLACVFLSKIALCVTFNGTKTTPTFLLFNNSSNASGSTAMLNSAYGVH
jgi:hypothetical protein